MQERRRCQRYLDFRSNLLFTPPRSLTGPAKPLQLSEPMMNDRRRSAFHFGLLIALCGLMYFPYLGSSPFFDKGEPREAIAVQDILQRGEWLFPLKRATAIPSKPPLFHWSAALAARVSGRIDEAIIRLPSTLYAALGVLALYAIGRRIVGSDAALLGAAILATTSVYATQALSARVDMTLTFFVTLSLLLFYALHRGFVARPVWRYAFYAVLGIGTLAKGPLGLLLPVLVIISYLTLRKRWDELLKLIFHPGLLLTAGLALGWYVVAVMRAGEGFVDKQLLQENLERFVGGSGHSHPVHYYLPYLMALGLPWSLFLPFLLWDSLRNFAASRDATLFLKLWFVVMFVFFSVSLGKRPVYLLPLYPALSLLLGLWLYERTQASRLRLVLYRGIAALLALIGLLLIVITFGGLWNHDPGWFFDPIERLLKPKDRANLAVVTSQLASFGWLFTVVSLTTAALWLSLAGCFWTARLKPAAHRLVLISILMAFITRGIVIPEMAQAKSYRDFMRQVNQQLGPDDALYLYGDDFNSDPIIFYRGELIQTFGAKSDTSARVAASGNEYYIMTQRSWKKLRNAGKTLAPPSLESEGKGPEGDAPLVLVRINDLR
jgi:4-amino-4-deoxy-L-arabinose transferase-like glycosyltransferase